MDLHNGAVHRGANGRGATGRGLVGLAFGLTLVVSACGSKNNFAGKAQPTPTPTEEPAPIGPMESAPESSGADIRTVDVDGGFDSDGPGTASGPTIPQTVSGVSVPQVVSQPQSIPVTSQPTTSLGVVGPSNVGAESRPVCNGGVFFGNKCIKALQLYRWEHASSGRQIHSAVADQSCATRPGSDHCPDLALGGSGYVYKGVAGVVFPESAAADLASVGSTPARLVVCHRAPGDMTRTDTFHVNPTAAQFSALSFECELGKGGRESFLIIAGAKAGLQPLHVWNNGMLKSVAPSAATAPAAGYTLDAGPPLGYVVGPR